MSHRKLGAVLAALGTVVALAACGSAPEQRAALSNVAASQPAASPVAASDYAAPAAAGDATVDPNADPAAGTTDGAVDAAPADPAADAAAAEEAPAAGRVATTLKAIRHPRLGDVVVDQKGMLLYRFDKDKAKPPTSNCSGTCATNWPPVLVEGLLKISGIDETKVGQITRSDGGVQVTLGGWPLYYFAKDVKAGDWKGQGSGGVWFASTKTGAKNTACANMTATTGTTATTATGTATAAGRVVTTLKATNLAGLGAVVVDQKGMVLYRFDKDTAKPPASNCSGACATAWPPVLMNGPVQLSGIDATKIGQITRSDGSVQVTLGGWPLYYFAKDVKAGDWKGQGSGGVWFAVTGTGAKNTTEAAAAAPAQPASGGYAASGY